VRRTLRCAAPLVASFVIVACGDGLEPADDEPVAVTVRITSPNDSASFLDTEELVFAATTATVEGVAGGELALVWTSDRDGRLGSGARLTAGPLTLGSHRIQVAAERAGSRLAVDTVRIEVATAGSVVARRRDDRDVDAGYVVGQVLIRFGAGDDGATREAVRSMHGLRALVEADPDDGWYAGLLPQAATPGDHAAVVSALEADERVRDAGLNPVITTMAVPVDFNEAGAQAALRMTGLDVYWRRLSGSAMPGTGTRIAIIDSGVEPDPANGDFASLRYPAKFAAPQYLPPPGCALVSDPALAFVDPIGHGTLIASIAAGGGSDGNGLTGVAPGARIVPIRIDDPSDMLTLSCALRHALENGADVINLSVGSEPTAENRKQAGRLLGPVLRTAAERGVIVVAAAGNCAARTSACSQAWTQDVQAVAGVDGSVWVVGAADGAGTGARPESQEGAALDLLAPGTDVCADSVKRPCGSGTSVAAPIVAGLAALYKADAALSGDVGAALRDRTLRLGSAARDDRHGYGRVIAGIHTERLDPAEVEAGTPASVVLTGRNFDPDARVVVDGAVVPSTWSDQGRILFAVIAPARDSVPVHVEHPRGALASDTVWLRIGQPQALRFSMVVAGAAHSCGLHVSGAAYCWGFRQALGNGAEENSPFPVPVAGGLRFISLTAGSLHTCGLTLLRDAYCWGSNTSGQIGDGTEAYRSSPVPVSGGLRFAALDAGAVHTCGVTVTGDGYCWGWNFTGQLGNGRKNEESHVPVFVGAGFTAMAAGHVHTCGSRNTDAYCWGHNGPGRLGITSTDDRGVTVSTCPSPSAQLVGECLVPAPVLGGLQFRSLAAGWNHTCGLTVSGAAYCWGQNGHGAVGVDSAGTGDFDQPIAVEDGRTYHSITAGQVHSCALTAAGSVDCWGGNLHGQLGDGTAVSRRRPVAAATAVSFTRLDAGTEHTCALGADGRAFCWGENLFGQIGNGTIGGSVTVPTATVTGATGAARRGAFSGSGVKRLPVPRCRAASSSSTDGCG
jgi:alpha-tubulin suppressor-like RCC1 family protein/subtilisin family serine protease